jgi:hypothetical protein
MTPLLHTQLKNFPLCAKVGNHLQFHPTCRSQLLPKNATQSLQTRPDRILTCQSIGGRCCYLLIIEFQLIYPTCHLLSNSPPLITMFFKFFTDNTGSPSTAPSTSAITLPFPLSPGDLLRFTLPSGKDLYLEITKCRQAVIEALCEGEILRIDTSSTGAIEHAGYWPRVSDSWVKQYPTLQAALKSLRQRYQEDSEALPSSLLLKFLVGSGSGKSGSGSNSETSSISMVKVTSLSEFEAEIATNPSFWCDGTAPNDPTPTSEQTALLSAGELSCFFQGLRGVLLVQLDMVVTPDLRVPLPLLRPFVLSLLKKVIEAKKGVVVMPSTAPGGGAASLVVAAKQQPFKAWGAKLAEIGVQAALIADSPYYKLLVGRILGYKEENIVHHIQVGRNFCLLFLIFVIHFSNDEEKMKFLHYKY